MVTEGDTAMDDAGDGEQKEGTVTNGIIPSGMGECDVEEGEETAEEEENEADVEVEEVEG
jgi:hypothetical protein